MSEVPSINPKLDAMCEMLKTIHDLQERNKMLEAQIEKMKCCAKCAHCNTYITSCIPRKRFVKLEDVCKDFELRR